MLTTGCAATKQARSAEWPILTAADGKALPAPKNVRLSRALDMNGTKINAWPCPPPAGIEIASREWSGEWVWCYRPVEVKGGM